MPDSYYQHLLEVAQNRGAGFIVLIDPDHLPLERLPRFVQACEEASVDAFFIGGSLVHALALEQYVAHLKQATQLPVIGFPGAVGQITPNLDAILYLSVISSNNPEYLFRQHIQAAPLIKRMGLEPIPTGYMLIESGRTTAAQFMSGALPLPRHKPELAAATALAAEMMGMKLLFTDGGSGADLPVPETLIQAIRQTCSIPLVVGGGLKTPEAIEQKVRAGASFIVVGNAIEKNPDARYIAELASAAHVGMPRPIEGFRRSLS